MRGKGRQTIRHNMQVIEKQKKSFGTVGEDWGERVFAVFALQATTADGIRQF